MKGFVVNTTKSALAKVPENERILFLLLGHLANELSVLKKLFFFCAHSGVEDKWQRRANIVQALVVARVLIGKLCEGWELLNWYFFRNGLSKTYEPLLEVEGRETLSNLKRYFSKKNLIRNVRNSLSFHYSGEIIAKAFETAPENEPDEWQMCQTDNVGNCLFFSSEAVVNHALLDIILPGQPQEAMDRLFSESTEVASWFIDVISCLLEIIVQRHLLDNEGRLKMVPVDIGPVLSMDEVYVPYFVSKPAAENGDSPSMNREENHGMEAKSV